MRVQAKSSATAAGTSEVLFTELNQSKCEDLAIQRIKIGQTSPRQTGEDGTNSACIKTVVIWSTNLLAAVPSDASKALNVRSLGFELSVL